MSQLVYNQEEDINKIKKGFEMFDVENYGQINPFELKVTMEEMNLKDKNPFIYELISSLCARKDIKSRGGITSDEFISFLQSRISDTESREGIKTIFEVFSEYDDTIPMPKFYQTAREVGDEEGGTEIRDLVEKSKTGGKEIDFNEFYDIMKGKNPIVKYSQYSYRRRNENNRSRSRSRSQSKGRNNREYEVEYNNSYRNSSEKPKSEIVYMEKIITEQINDNPVKIDRYHYKKKVGFEKDGDQNSYSGKKTRNIEDNFDNDNKSESIEMKRYHRRYRDNKTTTETTTIQTNNFNNMITTPNVSLSYSRYRKKE